MTAYNESLDYNLHTLKTRPWGFEIPITFYHESGDEYNYIMVFRTKKEPDEKAIKEQISFWGDKILNQPIEIDNIMMSKSEIEAILREKGYLTEEQKLEDLPYKKAIK